MGIRVRSLRVGRNGERSVMRVCANKHPTFSCFPREIVFIGKIPRGGRRFRTLDLRKSPVHFQHFGLFDLLATLKFKSLIWSITLGNSVLLPPHPTWRYPIPPFDPDWIYFILPGVCIYPFKLVGICIWLRLIPTGDVHIFFG